MFKSELHHPHVVSMIQWRHERQTFLQPSTRGFGGVVQAGVTDIKLVSHGFLSCGGDVTVKLVQLKDHQR
ncbi:hypothetical protein TB2_040857 [Malus domestica]|uniref:Uncharacterized protein n=1 Tax=Malus domestica TaxID=3750 RepID=A0A498JCN0_MALDO|nr:hypothetical protein DVH24_011920 [Malus domestica]